MCLTAVSPLWGPFLRQQHSLLASCVRAFDGLWCGRAFGGHIRYPAFCLPRCCWTRIHYYHSHSILAIETTRLVWQNAVLSDWSLSCAVWVGACAQKELPRIREWVQPATRLCRLDAQTGSSRWPMYVFVYKMRLSLVLLCYDNGWRLWDWESQVQTILCNMRCQSIFTQAIFTWS